MLYLKMGRRTEAEPEPLWNRAWPRIVARGDEYTADGLRRVMRELLDELSIPIERFMEPKP